MKIDVRNSFIIIVSLIAILIGASLVAYAVTTIKARTISLAQDKLRSDLELSARLNDLSYPGYWHFEEHKLFKGVKPMEEKYVVVDEISRLTGGTVGYSKAHVPVSTNIMIDGKRILEKRISPEIAKVVLEQGKIYIGEKDVAGARYIMAYQPIKDRLGRNIGMWYVGVPAAPYDDASQKNTIPIILLALGLIVVAIAASYIIAKRKATPISTMDSAAYIASGVDAAADPAEILHADDIGQVDTSLDVMAGKISTVSRQIKNQANSMYKASTQLSDSTNHIDSVMKDLTPKIQGLAELGERLKTIIEKMTAGVQQAAAISPQMAETAQTALSVAIDGQDAMNKNLYQMKLYKANVSSTADIFKILDSKSSEIVKFIDILNSIARQTNQVALNVAGEAAKNLEDGLVFTQVAEEVRQLADESEAACKQITERLKVIKAEIVKGVRVIDNSANQVSVGSDTLAVAGADFRSIIEATRNIRNQIQQVSEGNEQFLAWTNNAIETVQITATTAGRTSNAIQEINALIQKQKAGLEEIDGATNKLNNRVQDMEGIIKDSQGKGL